MYVVVLFLFPILPKTHTRHLMHTEVHTPHTYEPHSTYAHTHTHTYHTEHTHAHATHAHATHTHAHTQTHTHTLYLDC